MKRVTWLLLKAYGELCWRLHSGSCPGYYWALRAMVNWCGRDWYGRPARSRFNAVGWVRF